LTSSDEDLEVMNNGELTAELRRVVEQAVAERFPHAVVERFEVVIGMSAMHAVRLGASGAGTVVERHFRGPVFV
jgi:hypothetical protein